VIFAQENVAREVLLCLHHSIFLLTLHEDQLQVLVIDSVLSLRDLALQVFDLLLETIGVDEVGECARAEVFANHEVFVEKVLVTLLNGVQLLLELVDVFLFSHLHLLQDLLLRVKLAVQVLRLRDRLVHLVLELDVLLLKDLNLTV